MPLTGKLFTDFDIIPTSIHLQYVNVSSLSFDVLREEAKKMSVTSISPPGVVQLKIIESDFQDHNFVAMKLAATLGEALFRQIGVLEVTFTTTKGETGVAVAQIDRFALVQANLFAMVAPDWSTAEVTGKGVSTTFTDMVAQLAKIYERCSVAQFLVNAYGWLQEAAKCRADLARRLAPASKVLDDYPP